MKRYLLFYFLLIAISPMFAQGTFHKTYDIAGGDDYGNAPVGSTKGIYVGGSTSNAGAGSYDMYLMRLDSSGAVQWQTQVGGTQSDAGRAVAPFQHIGFILGGTSNSYSVSHKNDVMLSLIDSTGNYYGSAIFGYDSLVETLADVISVGDTNLLVLGTTQANTNGGKTNVLIMRLDGQANVIWARSYGSPDFNISSASHIFNIPGAGFIAMGTAGRNASGFEDAWVINFDGDGHIQNQLQIGRDFYDDGRFFTVADNKIIIGGVAGSINGPNRSNIHIIALNPDNLTPIWDKNYGGDTASNLSFLAPSNDNNLLVGGNRLLPGQGQDAVVFKVSGADGSVVWAKSFGDATDQYLSNGVVLEDGSAVVSGSTGNYPGDAFVARIAADGSLCDGVDLGMEARDQVDSIFGPSIPAFVDSGINYVKLDTMATYNHYSVTETNSCLGTPVKQVASKDNSIKLYPNPTSGKLFVESAGWNDKVKVTVYNMVGSQVYTRTVDSGTQQFTIDLSNSPRGMYIISFNDGKTITTEKVSLN